MSIETEITRISTNVSETLNAVSEMGGTVPENATSDDMANGVRSIPVGAKINDSTSSPTTTYSSQKIDSEISKLNEANAAQDTRLTALEQAGGVTDEQVQTAVNNYLTENPVSGALTADEKALILKLFNNATYSANIGAAYMQLENIFNGGDVIYYSVTNNLTNITSDNTVGTIKAGFSYTATLADGDGAIPGVIAVTMGGIDVTEEMYSMGVVNIPCVSGDVVITAAKAPGPVYELASPLSITNSTAINTGYYPFANGDTDFTLFVNFTKTGTADVSGTVVGISAGGSGPYLCNNSWGDNDPWSWRGSNKIDLTLLGWNTPYNTAITHKAGTLAFGVYELNDRALSYLGDITVKSISTAELKYSGYKPVSVNVNICKIWNRVLSVDELANVMGV